MEIYTKKTAPFRMGGELFTNVKTEVEPLQVIKLGGWDVAIIRNPCVEMHHACLVGCGAMIGSAMSDTALIEQIAGDIETGDKKVMEEQIAKAMNELKYATFEEPETFFSTFKGVARRNSI